MADILIKRIEATRTSLQDQNIELEVETGPYRAENVSEMEQASTEPTTEYRRRLRRIPAAPCPFGKRL